MDFSSAFNTILPQILEVTNGGEPLCYEVVLCFPHRRQQQVRVNSTLSSVKDINMGAPQ